MNVVLTQKRNVVAKPICIWVDELELGTLILANIHGGDEGTITLGKYTSSDRAKEIIEEIFKSDYYEMPLE